MKSTHTQISEAYISMNEANTVVLPSVGSVIDQNGYVYPQLAKGGYDKDAYTHVANMSTDEEWYQSLSSKDLKAVRDIMKKKKLVFYDE